MSKDSFALADEVNNIERRVEMTIDIGLGDGGHAEGLRERGGGVDQDEVVHTASLSQVALDVQRDAWRLWRLLHRLRRRRRRRPSPLPAHVEVGQGGGEHQEDGLLDVGAAPLTRLLAIHLEARHVEDTGREGGAAAADCAVQQVRVEERQRGGSRRGGHVGLRNWSHGAVSYFSICVCVAVAACCVVHEERTPLLCLL